MSDQKPNLQFHFTNQNGKIVPLYFASPSRVIVAWSINDVIPCLKLVEQAVEDGNYAAGYLSYEAAPAFDSDYKVKQGGNMPLLWFGIFNKPMSAPPRHIGQFSASPWTPSISIHDYYKALDRIQHAIDQGKTEQVNYTLHMESSCLGDTFAFYNELRAAQDAKYTAYANIGDFTILSASPELFFRLNQQTVTTRPMKGTIKRGKTNLEDAQNKKTLQHSKKDQTENWLITKLMKEELKKLTSPDNIEVTNQYEIEQYPTVYQMTSTVKAAIPAEKTITDIFRALFPCGSITGSPKKDAMKLIEQLENGPREVYCGAMGFITPDKEAVFNVPIRTVTIDNLSGQAKYGVGGGITQQSTKDGEYQEVLAKAEVLKTKRPSFDLLETLGLFDGAYLVFEQHLQRLEQSAVYFGFSINLKEIKKALIGVATENPNGSYKIRLLAAKKGQFTIECDQIIKMDQITARLAKSPVDKDDVFFYHKTTNRSAYEFLKQQQPDVFDVLLYNEAGEITEFTTGNIVVELNNELVTPPVQSGLLAGTFRESLLAEGVVQEKSLQTSILNKCTNIWYINSVRGWVTVHFKR